VASWAGIVSALGISTPDLATRKVFRCSKKKQEKFSSKQQEKCSLKKKSKEK
jgi:hypothetical protein